MTLSDQIKAALPIANEFERDGHGLRSVRGQFVCLCPLHQERTPSCYVTPSTGRFKCFGCGATGSIIDYWSLSRDISPADAITELAARLNNSTTGNERAALIKRAAPKPEPPALPRSLPKLPELQVGNVSELAHLAKRRNLTVEALQMASDRGLLWLCDLADGPNLVRAWVITDRTRRNAQARRLDGQLWHHAWNFEAKRWGEVEPERRRKVRGFTGNQASWPVGLEEAQQFESIAILEGVDILAAFHFLIIEGCEEAVGPVAILGAGNRIPIDVVKLFAGKRVRIFPHVDANGAGLRAAANWESQLLPVAAHVDAFDFAGLVQSGGKPVKDLNDLTNIDCDCLDAESAAWSIMNFK
ncbi:MAG: CHC2 zinc finger domain-containing protein [Chthoniobacterales bacterium]